MGDQQKNVTKWVQKLIESELPKHSNERIVQEYLSFFMKILSSRFGIKLPEEGLIHNQLIRKAKSTQQQLRVQELLNKLELYPAAIQKKSSILYLLSALSNSDEIKQNFTNVEALFKNSNLGLNSTMEIENNITMNTLTNNQSNSFNSQTQRSFLQQSNFQLMQTVRKIGNKGNPNIDLTEKDLIRDLLFAFYAIDGQYIAFNKQDEIFQLKPHVSVSDPVREIVNKLASMGDLYRKVQLYLQGEPQGQICEALHYAIRDELNEYYRLIAIFENELNSNYNSNVNHGNASLLFSQSAHQNQQQNKENIQNNPIVQNGINSNQFTLRKLQLWVIEPIERLKWLSIICDATKGMSGFQVISAVNAYETQGSPPIQQLISRILQSIVQPFIKYVNSWVYNGELNDPLGEFFVTENIGETDVWNKRYSMVIKQIPNIIDKNNAMTIFNIGRSINFLHKSCKSSDWKLNLVPCDLKIIDKKSFDIFKQWIDQAALLTNNRIVNILVDKYELKFHLQNIKKYILMGQGDFIQTLMEILSEQLSKNSNEIHRHNLLSQLDGVIKGNNNAFLESSQRLDIKLLEASPGDKGWDIFTLDYNVDSPIDTILSSSVIKNYLKVFNFLWRIRRVSHCLSQVWIDHMKYSNLIGKDKSQEPILKLMKKFNILRHQMTHFINNLTCYIMVDAIETTWKQFLDDFDKTKDFAQIIQTHSNFVQSILDKSLLTERNINIYRLMNSLFNLIIKFRNTQMVILSEILEEYERIRAIKNTNKQKEILNQFGKSNCYGNFDQENDSNEEGGSDHLLESEDFQIPQTTKQFKFIQSDFQKQFTELLVLLKKEDKLRFLSFKLDFNEYYSSKQNDSLGNFGQEQLNKYSASGNLKIQNFNMKINSENGSSNNLNSEQSPFSIRNNSKQLNTNQGNPFQRDTSQFFKPDSTPQNFKKNTNEASIKESFFSNNSIGSNLKNSEFFRKDQIDSQSNQIFNQDQSLNGTNSNMVFNKVNLSVESNVQKLQNNFFQGKNLPLKNDFFKSNIQYVQSNQILNKNKVFEEASSNKFSNSKMEVETNSENQSSFSSNILQKNNVFQDRNSFGNVESEAFKQRIQNQKNDLLQQKGQSFQENQFKSQQLKNQKDFQITNDQKNQISFGFKDNFQEYNNNQYDQNDNDMQDDDDKEYDDNE